MMQPWRLEDVLLDRRQQNRNRHGRAGRTTLPYAQMAVRTLPLRMGSKQRSCLLDNLPIIEIGGPRQSCFLRCDPPIDAAHHELPDFYIGLAEVLKKRSRERGTFSEGEVTTTSRTTHVEFERDFMPRKGAEEVLRTVPAMLLKARLASHLRAGRHQLEAQTDPVHMPRGR